MTQPILSFQNVKFERRDRTILDGINWTIQPGQNWASLGLNGAGKTTMLKIIHGDLWPSSGRVEVLGGLFGHTSIPELTKKIGWISTALQDGLRPGDVVESIVLSGKFASIGIYQDFTRADLQEAKAILTEMGGESLIGKTYQVLSQGERQLVMISRSLMAHPELMVFDEPCNGLDLFAREALLERIANIQATKNPPTMLFVSHYTEEILPCFQNVLLLKDGQAFSQGRREDILTKDSLEKFYNRPIQTTQVGAYRIAVYPS
ncbi:ABC transporter ATP-binding protein [Paucilactobacillus nenjiangensis]|uniref:ABC transporter ATP-binding protein n=1 Tax=Paucilactobacillus nenjiangensis TaxID=1296540 RepID=UPI0028D52677|nr:ABC transporter ATP-binding protein [Paucilactobacillus nenjiangensis]